MKRTILRCAAGLLIAAALLPTALAAEPFPAVTEVQVCYPTSVTRSEDGAEIRKVYDLSPEQDPAGIPRSDFEQDGFHYTLTDLLLRLYCSQSVNLLGLFTNLIKKMVLSYNTM